MKIQGWGLFLSSSDCTFREQMWQSCQVITQLDFGVNLFKPEASVTLHQQWSRRSDLKYSRRCNKHCKVNYLGYFHTETVCLLLSESDSDCFWHHCRAGLDSDSLDSTFVFILRHHKSAQRTRCNSTFLRYYFGPITLSKAPQLFWVSQCFLAIHGTCALWKLMMSSPTKTHKQVTSHPEQVYKFEF